MRTQDKRGVRRVAAVLALLVGVATALVALSTSASAEEEYVQEKVVSYPLVNLEGDAQPECTGTTSIAQTTGNSIQASTSVECRRELLTPLLVRSYVGIFTGTPTAVASKDDGCFDCRTFTVSTSVPAAAPDTSYCAIGFGNIGIGLTEGKDTVCITT